MEAYNKTLTGIARMSAGGTWPLICRVRPVEETLRAGKTSEAIHAEIAREVITLLDRIFAERKRLGGRQDQKHAASATTPPLPRAIDKILNLWRNFTSERQ